MLKILSEVREKQKLKLLIKQLKNLDIIGIKIKMNKKSQLKIQEMAFMLVAVILFFILVGLFATSIIYKNLQQSSTQIKEEKTFFAIENLAGSAEFICTNGKPNCVDSDKLIALLNKRKYEDFWPFSSLKVIKINAFNKKENEMIKCSLQNYPDCDIFEIYDKKAKNERIISSFVALCKIEYENNYNYDKCEIAKLIAGSEVK